MDNNLSARRISATFMAKDTAPRPVKGGLPSNSSGSVPMQWQVISSSMPTNARSTKDRPLVLWMRR